jgi:hypothetical protein
MLGGQQPPDTTEPADQDHLARPGLDAFLEAKLTPPAVRSAWIPATTSSGSWTGPPRAAP